MGVDELCTKHTMEIEQLKKDVVRLSERVDKVEGRQFELETFNARLEANLKNYEEKFTKIELSLNSIVRELRDIGEKLIYLKVKNKVEEDVEKEDGGLVKTMVNHNNKILWIAIAILGMVTLVSLGVKIDDVFKLLGK